MRRFQKLADIGAGGEPPWPPAMTTQRIESLASASRSACVIAAYIGCVSAFFFSGRFSRMLAHRAVIGYHNWVGHGLPS